MDLRKFIWWMTLAVMALAIVLGLVAPEHPNVRRPVWALQFARTWAELSILLAIDRSRYWLSTQIDFGFLVAYTLLFAAVALDAARGVWRWVIAGVAVAAGLADFGENLAILRVLPLQSFENEMALAIRQWSLTKWSLLGLTWLALGVVQYRQWVPGALYTVAGVLTWWGCLDPRRIEFPLIPLALALAWHLFTYSPWSRSASFKSRSTASGSSL